MISSRIAIANIFPATNAKTGKTSAACFAIAPYMLWQTNAAAISLIPKRVSRIAPIA
jgi:hypothetical protein